MQKVSIYSLKEKWWSCGGNPSTGGKTTTNLQKNNTQKFGDTKKEKGPKVWWCKIGKNKE